MSYSPERREAVLKKLLPPNNRPVTQVAEEEGISAATLYQWRNKARSEGRLLPDGSADPEGWSSADKLNAVIETAALSEAEIGEYCRKRGLYTEQIQRWRTSCEQANDRRTEQERQDKETLKAERRRQRELERELKRKDEALAETAALLTLQKKPMRSGGTGTNDARLRSGSRPRAHRRSPG